MNKITSKKLLLFSLEYPPFKGGIAHYYGHLVKFWPGEKIEILNNNNGQLINKNRRFLKWWPALTALLKAIQTKKIDYVLVGHILPLGTVAWLLSFIFNFKYCVFLHGYDLNLALAQNHKRWLTKAILDRADKIICANSYTEAQVKKIISTTDLSKVALVNPGIESETVVYNEDKIIALKNHYNLTKKTILLTLGRLVKRKGVDMVLEGLKIALKEAPELAYVVIGQGEEEANLRAKIADLGLSEKALILTDIDDETKMDWYKLADIFIMTTRQIGADMEGFGIVYLEAGLAGKPVIASQSGGVADAVADNINGLLVDGSDPEQISEAIIKLAKYEKLRQRLGDAGRQRALEMFSWKKQAEKIYNLISK